MIWALPWALLAQTPVREGLVSLTTRMGAAGAPGERALQAYTALRTIWTLHNRTPEGYTVSVYMGETRARALADECFEMPGFKHLGDHIYNLLSEAPPHEADGQGASRPDRATVRRSRELRFQR